MSFNNIMNPSGGVSVEHVNECSDPNDHLLEQILSYENVKQAWKRVKANDGAPGIDGVTVEEFPDLFRPRWAAIRESLLNGSYQPTPVRRTEVLKPTGGKRQLGIPIVLDRLIQQVSDQRETPVHRPDTRPDL